jgi:hypothetical protein
MLTRLRHAAAGAASLLLVAAVSSADTAPPPRALSTGSYQKGTLEIQLNRGAAQPLELTVTPTPDNCKGHIDLKLNWDEQKNSVTVEMHGKDVLEPYPTVHRTEGVDYFPNKFFKQTKDVVGGRYQLWLVTNGRLLNFYYDPTTLDLLGSELDFPTPPPNAIPISFPTLRLFPTPFFEPKANGDLDFKWTFAYDHAVRGDRPDLTEMYVTFPPPNLCGVNPYRIDLSTLRPYVSKPLPAKDAPSFSEYLRGGMLFDITTEPPQYFMEPPTATLIATYSQATAVGGGVPRGWTFDIDASFGNVNPPIRPWPGAGSCTQYTDPVHTKGLNFCQ